MRKKGRYGAPLLFLSLFPKQRVLYSVALDRFLLFCFVTVYVAMLLGEIPPLALDRTGIAILGAIALVPSKRFTPPLAWEAVDASTLALLAGPMVVTAQLRLAGFYTFVARKLAAAALAPPAALAMVLLAAAGLSAVLVNDIVCLAWP